MGYKDKISKEKILFSEITKHLNEISKVGESRHIAKAIGKAEPYIFSIKTFENYKHTMEIFSKWCIANHSEIKHIDDCKKYVEEYINEMIKSNYSSYTQKARLAGFRKFYKDRFENVYTDSRKRSQIKRGRKDNEMARHFSEENNKELIHFCKCCGLRRQELENLKGGCVSIHSDGHWYIDRVKGKGGRVRNVRILNDDLEVIKKIAYTKDNEFVWGRVHSKANIHGYRADYCEELYKVIARDTDSIPKRDIYICREDMAGLKLDKKAMKEVSENLGHSRIGIIAYNYLYGLKNCLE